MSEAGQKMTRISDFESTKELAESAQLLLKQGVATIERLCDFGVSLTNLISKIEHMESLIKSVDKSFLEKRADEIVAEHFKKEGLKVG